MKSILPHSSRPLHVLLCTLILSMGVASLVVGETPEKTSSQSVLVDVDVSEQVRTLIEADWVDQDRRFPTRKQHITANVPSTKAVTTQQDASGGCDGIKNGLWGFHVASGQQDPWWQVDLGKDCRLDRIVIYNRCDSRQSRVGKIQILTASSDGDPECKQFEPVYQHNGTTFGGVRGKPLTVRFDDREVTARVVRLQIDGSCSLALDEIEVYTSDAPNTNAALNRPADQISVSPYSWNGTMPDRESTRIGHKPLVPRSGSQPSSSRFSLMHVRDQVERAFALIQRIRTNADPVRLNPLVSHLKKLDQRLTKMETSSNASNEINTSNTTETDEAARRELYLDVRRTKRQIAFCNRLLQFDRLLFAKRHDSGGVFHMCDQFYGCNAKPGGGLFVLERPFGPNPKRVNLLENAVVEKGRLAGQKLTGACLSPELSFDGRTIYFAHSECKAKQTYQWAPEYSYHLFKINVDGTGLVQLTDGSTDDFDPCELPNGRIAFISERRGGYLRCGRHCPVYTLYSMRPDGSDIICLSFHETHEWHPSVTNDGMLVYTRWDYVDRDTNIAHHLWTSFPDGRDPRSFHGNYPIRREDRPWMEMSIRAIPGSSRFVAVTGAHHGHAFGSLVLIDHRHEDDGAMSQLTRLTPDVPFPEAEGRPIQKYMVYGTPWPLSEDDYLCVYDPNAKNRGIYWIDRFGNKELLYRDPAVSCISPIPLRPRPMPPLIPSQTSQAAEDRHKNNQATVAVMNVYDADFEWPADTKIEALRIIQLLPKSTHPPNKPRIGIANQTNARAVLGTVPVEADGSVYFEAPPGKALYFQAIDQQGSAVQSMRSVTYLHPGEQLTCQGCHERKRVPPSPTHQPLALRRPASKIRPDVDGSNPFNFVRLVQPALDRNCVDCHRQKKALDLSGTLDGPNGWSRSYTNLAEKYGFYFHTSNGSINSGVHGGVRTTVGAFGARASKLIDYLHARHHNVKLSDADRHRFTLWLDANSEFFGSYEKTSEQARGQIVLPTLE